MRTPWLWFMHPWTPNSISKYCMFCGQDILNVNAYPYMTNAAFTALCGTLLWLMIDGERVVFVHTADITHVLTATTQDTCWSTNGRTAWQLTSAHGAIDEMLSSVTTSPLNSWLRYVQQESHHGMCVTHKEILCCSSFLWLCQSFLCPLSLNIWCLLRCEFRLIKMDSSGNKIESTLKKAVYKTRIQL